VALGKSLKLPRFLGNIYKGGIKIKLPKAFSMRCYPQKLHR
jgi:hypothetical protein